MCVYIYIYMSIIFLDDVIYVFMNIIYISCDKK